MKRLAATSTAVLAAALCAAAGVSAAAGPAPRARLRGFLCQRAPDPAQRSISIDAVMRPVPHTKKMAIKFALLSKVKSPGNYTAVRGGDLGTWLTPVGQPTLGQRPGDVWTISHPVTGLTAPATYRYRVTFRWTGDRDHVLATHAALSPKCFQPELRPDLLVASITVGSVPNHPKQASYTALIRNTGATRAGPFQVVFTPAGSFSKAHTIQLMRPHSSRQETFIGPLCTASTAPTITVDPSHQVDESNTNNNSLAAKCPATI